MTNLFLANGAKHVLEKALEVILALAVEKADDTGD